MIKPAAEASFSETGFVDWTFGLTVTEFIRNAQVAEPHTRQRMLGQLEGALAAIRLAVICASVIEGQKP